MTLAPNPSARAMRDPPLPPLQLEAAHGLPSPVQPADAATTLRVPAPAALLPATRPASPLSCCSPKYLTRVLLLCRQRLLPPPVLPSPSRFTPARCRDDVPYRAAKHCRPYPPYPPHAQPICCERMRLHVEPSHLPPHKTAACHKCDKYIRIYSELAALEWGSVRCRGCCPAAALAPHQLHPLRHLALGAQRVPQQLLQRGGGGAPRHD